MKLENSLTLYLHKTLSQDTMQPLIKYLIILFLFQDVLTSWQVTLEIQDDTIYSKGYEIY